MKFFCLQPDIVEDVPSVRYKTKSTNHNAKTGNSGGGGNHGITGLFLPMTTKHPAPSTTTTNNGTIMTMMGATNRSRTSVSVPAHGAPKSVGPSVSVGARKHSSIGGTGIGQAFAPATAPIHHPPVSAPPATVYLGPSHSTTTTTTANVGRGQAITNDPKAYGHHVTSAIPATMMVDSDRELSGPSALRRKSRRMSAPLVSLGLSAEKNGNNVGMESGNESSREKKVRRVSKLVIGNPEGFRHEAHVGVGDAFAMGYGATRGGGGGAAAVADTTHVHEDATRQARAPSVHESWNVEAWRADIERTRKPNSGSSDGNVANPQPAARPKGPRPTSVTPSSAAAAISVSASVDPRKNSTRARKRSSVDSGLPRPSFERPSFERDPERERDSEREGASTEPPTSTRPGVLLPAGRTSPTGASVGYSQRSRSRSRSGSDSFGHGTRPVIIHQQQQQQPQPSSSPPSSAHQRYQTASQTHIPGQDSITSLASTTFSNPTSQSSHATTATSLTRSHSDKPYFHHQHHHHHQHQSPLQQYYQQQQQRQQHHPQSSSYSGHESGGGRFWDPNGTGQDGGPTAAATVSGSTSASLLQRSVSANAAVRPTLAPSSTSSTATAASVASSSVTLTMGSSTIGAGVGGAASRKPIPIPRRKPVPQHLPATVEVSPFPSMFVENSNSGQGGGGGRQAREHELIPDLPLELQKKVMAQRAIAAAGGAGAGAGVAEGGM
ncbi:hypothetical protein FRC17_004922, partial [Serendipita sp. 399]